MRWGMSRLLMVLNSPGNRDTQPCAYGNREAIQAKPRGSRQPCDHSGLRTSANLLGHFSEQPQASLEAWPLGFISLPILCDLSPLL